MPAHQRQSPGPRIAVLATLVALVLIAATVSLVVVSLGSDRSDDARAAASANSPASSGAPSTTSTTSPTAVPSPQTSPVAQNSSSSAGSDDPRGPITYTVKKGDNLTVIAAWFKLHGYGDLYQRNKKIIGGDPDLIRPGQKITISTAGVSTSG